jgi:hypothetical protein
MGARKQTIDPLSETPFWRTPLFVWSAAAVAALLLAGGTMYLVKLNKRQQLQWRLEEDPELSRIKDGLVKRITATQPGNERLPRALWLGQIKDVRETASIGSEAPSCLIEMESPSLLAGTRGKKDGELLAISGQDYPFPVARPRKGETWMIAVRRDKEDRSLIYAAHRAELKK